MASDLDGLRWRTLISSQLWTLWVQDSIEATWCASEGKFVPIYSWVLSAYWWKDTVLLVFHRSGLDIDDRRNEENKEEVGQGQSPGVHLCILLCWWGWRVIFNKDSAVSQIGANPRDDISRYIDRRCAGACEEVWYGQEYQMQQTCREQSEWWFFQSQEFPCHGNQSMISFVSLSRAVSVEWNLR